MLIASLASLVAMATISPAEDPKALIGARQFNDARALLEQRLARGAHDTETYFLLGIIAMQQGDYRRATSWFRRALVNDPRSARLRLELGRAFYLAGDYRNATLQFDRALGGNLPAGVQANVRRFLDSIRRRRRWTFQIDLSLAPDTNINAGPSASVTTLFGLPFELGPDARQHSGIGVVGDGSIEFAPRLGESWKWKSAVSVHRRDYRGTRFDDTIVSGWSGPEWLGKKLELSAGVSALSRWYGGRIYQRAIGGRADAIAYAGSRTALVLGLSAQQFDYPTYHDQSGPLLSVNAGFVRVLDPSTSISLQLVGARQKARKADLSNWSGLISVSASRDLRGGFTITVSPAYAAVRYDAADSFFGVKRRDRSDELRISLLNRRAMIWHLTPTVTYTWARRHSTIDLYDNHEQRIELGFTSEF